MFKPTSPTDPSEDLKKWGTQIRKGSLEMCLLAQLADRPRYGFEIVSDLAATGSLVVSEGTIYPLLNRLQNETLIVAHWQESVSGPPRKYYQLSSQGRDTLARMRTEWRTHALSVEALLAHSERPPCITKPIVPLDIAPVSLWGESNESGR